MARRVLQTAHGQAQRKMFALGWAWFGSFMALYGLAKPGSVTVEFMLWSAGLVVLGFVAALYRRRSIGLEIDADGFAVARRRGRRRGDGGEDPLKVVEPKKDVVEHLRLRTARGRWRRVPYVSHVTRESPLRWVYPKRNMVLVRAVGGAWESTGIEWTDGAGTDVVAAIEAFAAGRPAPERRAAAPEAPRAAQWGVLLQLAGPLMVPVVVMLVIVAFFDSDPVLLAIDALALAVVGLWVYRRSAEIDRRSASENAL